MLNKIIIFFIKKFFKKYKIKINEYSNFYDIRLENVKNEKSIYCIINKIT